MTEHPAIAAKCTKAQIELFEEIAAGQFVSAHPRRVQVLIDKGLVEIATRRETYGGFTFEDTEPFVPIPIHMQWCRWCDENVKGHEA